MKCAKGFYADKTTCSCLPEPTKVCPMDICWDGRGRDPKDCSCRPKPELDCTTVMLCAKGFYADKATCSCLPEPTKVCTKDLCWDGRGRDPKDCSCRPC